MWNYVDSEPVRETDTGKAVTGHQSSQAIMARDNYNFEDLLLYSKVGLSKLLSSARAYSLIRVRRVAPLRFQTLVSESARFQFGDDSSCLTVTSASTQGEGRCLEVTPGELQPRGCSSLDITRGRMQWPVEDLGASGVCSDVRGTSQSASGQ
jgi:hypothetical protein